MQVVIDADVRIAFEAFYIEQTEGDPDFKTLTFHDLLRWAASQGGRCRDQLLSLPYRKNVGLREWIGINLLHKDNGNPFPTMRRNGGGPDRGHSPALNAVMRKRHAKR